MMSEKKALKKELKVCKKQIRHSNYAVRGFMKKQLLQYHEIKYHQLICFNCGQKITRNPILHHKRYNWKQLTIYLFFY